MGILFFGDKSLDKLLNLLKTQFDTKADKSSLSPIATSGERYDLKHLEFMSSDSIKISGDLEKKTYTDSSFFFSHEFIGKEKLYIKFNKKVDVSTQYFIPNGSSSPRYYTDIDNITVDGMKNYSVGISVTAHDDTPTEVSIMSPVICTLNEEGFSDSTLYVNSTKPIQNQAVSKAIDYTEDYYYVDNDGKLQEQMVFIYVPSSDNEPAKLSNPIKVVVESINNSIKNLYNLISGKMSSSDLGDGYNSTKTYTSGELFIYDNTLYKVKDDITSVVGQTPPNATYYESTKIAKEIPRMILDGTTLNIYKG